MTSHDEHALATSHTGVHADHEGHGEHAVHDSGPHHDDHAHQGQDTDGQRCVHMHLANAVEIELHVESTDKVRAASLM